jgi:hypothetical protein
MRFVSYDAVPIEKADSDNMDIVDEENHGLQIFHLPNSQRKHASIMPCDG